MNIDKNKTYKTESGYPVEIGWIGQYAHGRFSHDGIWRDAVWGMDGRLMWRTHIVDCPLNLIEVRPRIKLRRWLNIWRDSKGGLRISVWDFEETAKNYRDFSIAVAVPIDIDVEEGYGMNGKGAGE